MSTKRNFDSTTNQNIIEIENDQNKRTKLDESKVEFNLDSSANISSTVPVIIADQKSLGFGSSSTSLGFGSSVSSPFGTSNSKSFGSSPSIYTSQPSFLGSGFGYAPSPSSLGQGFGAPVNPIVSPQFPSKDYYEWVKKLNAGEILWTDWMKKLQDDSFTSKVISHDEYNEILKVQEVVNELVEDFRYIEERIKEFKKQMADISYKIRKVEYEYFNGSCALPNESIKQMRQMKNPSAESSELITNVNQFFCNRFKYFDNGLKLLRNERKSIIKNYRQMINSDYGKSYSKLCEYLDTPGLGNKYNLTKQQFGTLYELKYNYELFSKCI